LVTEALTAIVRDHRLCGPWAHVHVGADETPDSGMWLPRSPRARFAFAFSNPGEGPRW
jgi:hypothetical protein